MCVGGKIQNTQANSNSSQAGQSPAPTPPFRKFSYQGSHPAISSPSPLTQAVKRLLEGGKFLPPISIHRAKFSPFSNSCLDPASNWPQKAPPSVPTNPGTFWEPHGSLFIEYSSFPGWVAQERIPDFKATDLGLDPSGTRVLKVPSL